MAELPRRTATYPLKKSRGLEQWRARRRHERHLREVTEAVRQRPFPFYGLPASWEGRRALSGTSYGKQTGLGGVRFAHVIGEGRRPVTVHVSTWIGSGGVAEAKEQIEFALGLRSGDEEPVGELEWMQMRIPVDGVLTDFEVIAGRSGEWGAAGAVGDVAVGVEVSNFAMADVVLETVTDVEPYLKGRRTQ